MQVNAIRSNSGLAQFNTADLNSLQCIRRDSPRAHRRNIELRSGGYLRPPSRSFRLNRDHLILIKAESELSNRAASDELFPASFNRISC